MSDLEKMLARMIPATQVEFNGEERRKLIALRNRVQWSDGERNVWTLDEFNRLQFAMWLIANGRLDAPLTEE